MSWIDETCVKQIWDCFLFLKKKKNATSIWFWKNDAHTQIYRKLAHLVICSLYKLMEMGTERMEEKNVFYIGINDEFKRWSYLR